jgi:hypothetical protein
MASANIHNVAYSLSVRRNQSKIFCRKQLFYPAVKTYGFQILTKLNSVHSAGEKYQLNRQAYKAILDLQKTWHGCNGSTQWMDRRSSLCQLVPTVFL